jgi:hypothetical protein
VGAIPKAGIPTQADHDPNDPEEHVAWALKDMPVVAGSGMLTHPALLRGWSKHLVRAGFIHTDAVASLADEDGNVHVSKLPAQEIRHAPPFRGPHHAYNNAARWVTPGESEPTPVRIPDIRKLTNQERQALLYQFHALGMIPQLVAPEVPLAHEE